MNKPKDHVAWSTFDGAAPASLREAIGIADQDDGRADQVARLAERLAPMLGAAGAAGVLGAQSTAAAAQAGVAKAGAAKSAANGASLWGAHAFALKVTAAAIAITTAGASAWLMQQSDARDARPTRVVPAQASTRPYEDPLHRQPAHRVQAHQHQADLPAQAHEIARAQAPAQPERASELAPAAAKADSKPAPHAGSLEDLTKEAGLLTEAKRALADDPARALRLASQHARRFRRGVLAQERELLAIRALVALQRAPQARARLARFHRDFPDSPHAQKADESVAESE